MNQENLRGSKNLESKLYLHIVYMHMTQIWPLARAPRGENPLTVVVESSNCDCNCDCKTGSVESDNQIRFDKIYQLKSFLVKCFPIK